jgi:hypothetical protein
MPPSLWLPVSSAFSVRRNAVPVNKYCVQAAQKFYQNAP